MEMAGFARAGVPGEFSPTPATAAASTDISSSTSYVTILASTVNIVTAGDILTLIGSLVSQQAGTGGTSFLRFTIDGVAYGGAAKTVSFGGASANVRQVLVVENLTVGPHTVTMDWKANNPATIPIASVPTKYHAVMTCQRNRATSRREMDGFAEAGWPMIYTCGTAYQALASPASSTTTTTTTVLFSQLVASRYAGSALLVRFAATGVGNDPANELDNKFQLFVDGVPRCGTGSGTAAAQGAFSATLMCVVPVLAGNHLVEIKWAGGAAPGSTITPASDGQFATLELEEVFCSDIEGLPDAEGFSTYAFAAKNLPRVGYVSLQSDFTNGGTIVPLLQEYFYVSGEQSAASIEFTGSLASNGVEPELVIRVDGALVHGATQTTTNGFTQCISVEAAMNLAQGRHLMQVTMNGITTFSPATNPTFSHANLLIREIAPLASP